MVKTQAVETLEQAHILLVPLTQLPDALIESVAPLSHAEAWVSIHPRGDRADLGELAFARDRSAVRDSSYWYSLVAVDVVSDLAELPRV